MATISNFGIPGVGDPGILQPKLKNLWRVTFSGLGLPQFENYTPANIPRVSSEYISVQATNISRPSVTFDEVQLDRYNSRAWVAGKHQWDPLTLTFEDDIGSKAADALTYQLELQQWLIGGGPGPFLGKAPAASMFKFATHLDQLDGREDAIERWVIEGCWIQQVQNDELDYAASEQVKITVTIRFDHAYRSAGCGYFGTTNMATGGQGVPACNVITGTGGPVGGP